jgi:hypothetical protein
MDDDKIAKIAEKASEGLLKSREPEIQRRSEEAARNIALNIAEGKISVASENIKRELESRARDIATNVVNDAIPKVISDLTSQIESLVANSIKDIESRIDERKTKTPSQLEDQSAANNLFNYTTRGSYEGQEVRFALNGQVLTPEEANEFGNINYIEFGGGGVSCVGLALYAQTIGTTTSVWISSGTIAGQIPIGMDSIIGQFISSAGSGQVWAEIIINPTNGDLVSVGIGSGSSVPSGSSSNFYYALGAYTFNGSSPTITNYGCGSLNVNICRNWFATEEPFYGVSFTR